MALVFAATVQLAFLLAVAAWSGDARAEDLVSIPFAPKPGQVFTVKIEKERVSTKNEKIDSHFKTSSVYNGLIVELSEAGMTVTWTPVDVKIEKIVEPTKKPALDLEKFAAALAVPITFEANEFGMPLRIVNRAEIEQKLLALINHLPAAELAEVTKTMRNMFFDQPDEIFAMSLMQEATVLAQGQTFLAQGQTFAVPRNETVKDVSSQPNPMGGPPVDYISKTRISMETEDTVTFESTGEFDADSLKASIRSFFETFAKSKGMPMETVAAGLANLKLRRDDVVTYVVSRTNGWTEDVKVEKKIVSSVQGTSQARTETWHLSVVLE